MLSRVINRILKPRFESATGGVWVGYAMAIAVPGFLFWVSLVLENENEVIFSLIHLTAALAVAVYYGTGPGLIAGVLAAFSVDYHYIRPTGWILSSPQSFAFFAISQLIVQAALSFVRVLKRAVQTTLEEKKRADAAIVAREGILSVVAHDLRQPLSAIDMRVALVSEMATNPEAIRHLQQMRVDVSRLNRMISDLLTFANIDSGQLATFPEPVPIRTLIDPTIENFQIAHPARQFVCLIETEAIVKADPVRARQVLANLISNAVKYGDVNSPIVVRVKKVADFVEIEIENRGIGISKDQLKRVFDRFARTANAIGSKTEGLGLGLFITKGLVEAQGGRIQVKSEPGQTTTFSFTLPLAATLSEGLSSPQLPRFEPAKSLAGKTVLVVDDSRDSLQLLQIFLERAGAAVLTALSGEEALHTLETKTADVAICDIEMAGGNGYEFLRDLRSKKIAIPVFAYSGHTATREVERMTSAGFTGLIPKPADARMVIEVLRKCLSSSARALPDGALQ